MVVDLEVGLCRCWALEARTGKVFMYKMNEKGYSLADDVCLTSLAQCSLSCRKQG